MCLITPACRDFCANMCSGVCVCVCVSGGRLPGGGMGWRTADGLGLAHHLVRQFGIPLLGLPGGFMCGGLGFGKCDAHGGCWLERVFHAGGLHLVVGYVQPRMAKVTSEVFSKCPVYCPVLTPPGDILRRPPHLLTNPPSRRRHTPTSGLQHRRSVEEQLVGGYPGVR